MIEFFRDVLDGPLYIIVTIFAIIFIMAIIGFLMERKKLEKEKKEHIAVVDTTVNVTPIEPVTVVNEQPVVQNTVIQQPIINQQPTVNAQNTVINNQVPLSDLNQVGVNNPTEVKPPVIVFEDPDQKKE